MVEQKRLTHLKWDSSFFGFKTGKYRGALETSKQARALLTLLANERYTLCYWEFDSVDSGSLCTAHALSPLPVFIADERVTLRCNLQGLNPGNAADVTMFEQGRNITRELFDLGVLAGQQSRFRKDPGIQERKFKEMFHAWVTQSVKREIADDVFVVEHQGLVAGMISVRYQPRPQIGLLAVAEKFQNTGIGSRLLAKTKQSCIERGWDVLDIVTQGMNPRALALYHKVGFVEAARERICHIWLESGKTNSGGNSYYKM